MYTAMERKYFIAFHQITCKSINLASLDARERLLKTLENQFGKKNSKGRFLIS